MRRTSPTTIYVGEGTATLPAIPFIDPKYRDLVNSHTIFESSSELGIPTLAATDHIPERLVACHDRPNYAPDAAVHFFVDDYRFEGVWSRPGHWMDRLRGVGAVLTPDFSIFSDWPLAMQIWQVYRNRWVGALLQAHGFTVIPSVSWSSPADVFFEGLPQRSVLAIATTGVRGRPEGDSYFRAGLMRLRELDPVAVLVYGGLADVADSVPFPVVAYPAFLDERRPVMEGVA